MSINDPVVVVGLPNGRYSLIQGRETYYDIERYRLEWDTIEQARQWAIDNLNKDPFDHLPESARAPIAVHARSKPNRRKRRQDDLPEAGRQPSLFGEEAELPPV